MVAGRLTRASDQDRERVAEILRREHAAGRLSPEEFEERSTAASAARTWDELSDLVMDLPVQLNFAAENALLPVIPPPPRQAPPRQAPRLRAPGVRWLPALAPVLMLAALAALAALAESPLRAGLFVPIAAVGVFRYLMLARHGVRGSGSRRGGSRGRWR